jgi:DNA mismatch repair protein MutL
LQGKSMSIQVLSSQTINKIAAGEVIENPSSVVKELIENAIDAGATQITIEIERGGFALIRVSDNGKGMTKDDLLLCIQRHATSKIQNEKDLEEIHTMGFRGEALASIGAISKLTITTTCHGETIGHTLVCLGGQLSSPKIASRTHGTTFEVRSLFYNVPARLKFQKSPTASQNSVRKMITTFALAYPTHTIRYFADGKEIIAVTPENIKERCLPLMGFSFVQGAIDVHFAEDSVELKGFIGDPLQAKGNRLGQSLFVNGRAVVSHAISHAIYEGYGTRLGNHLHPAFVLYLTLPPHLIDVNVHPQKREIRLRDSFFIQEKIRRAILEAFQGKQQENALPHKQVWKIESPLKAQETFELPPAEEPISFTQEEIAVIAIFQEYAIIYPTTWIPLPIEKGFLMVDLEGALARIRYERFLNHAPLPMQTLLFPITLNLTPHEKRELEQHLDEIQRMGIDLRPFGKESVIVDGLTPDIEAEGLQKLLEDLAEVFDQKLIEKQREKKLALSASYSARSQKKQWSELEAKTVIKALVKTSSPLHCPKGGKTVVEFSDETLKRLFQKKGLSF